MLYMTLKPGLFESTVLGSGVLAEITDQGLAKRLIEEGALQALSGQASAISHPPDVEATPPLPSGTPLTTLPIPATQLEILHHAGITTIESITEESLASIPRLKPATRLSILAAASAALASN